MSKIQNKKIVAKEYPLKDILSNNKYSIDYFQREYRWQKENIDQLIDDLYNAFRADYRPEHSTKDVANYATYFMGSIVVIAKDDASMSIIDGQQRLVTLSLIFQALNDDSSPLLSQEIKSSEAIQYIAYNKFLINT